MTDAMTHSEKRKFLRQMKAETGKTPFRARVLLNVWLGQQGQQTIDRHLSHLDFATALCRMISPRHAWREFEDRQEAEAYFVTLADQLGLLRSASPPNHQKETRQ